MWWPGCVCPIWTKNQRVRWEKRSAKIRGAVTDAKTMLRIHTRELHSMVTAGEQPCPIKDTSGVRRRSSQTLLRSDLEIRAGLWLRSTQQEAVALSRTGTPVWALCPAAQHHPDAERPAEAGPGLREGNARLRGVSRQQQVGDDLSVSPTFPWAHV